MPPNKKGRFRPLVLVIDDSVETRRAVCFYLSNEGYEVAEAAGGPTAFESVALNSPDLVLIDLNMPGPSGVLAAQRLRTIPQMEGVPVVACAGPDSQAYRDAARAARADAYLTKPMNPTVLLRLVKGLLNRPASGMTPTHDAMQMAHMVM